MSFPVPPHPPRRGRGRPPNPSARTRSGVFVKVPLLPQERDELDALAEERGVSRTALLVEAVQRLTRAR